MLRIIVFVLLMLVAPHMALAQNTICATPPVGDSSNRCASTAFVAQAVGAGLSTNLDVAFGSTRGSILERGASAWGIVTPGTSGLPWVSNGAGADPAYQALTGSGIASATIANSNLANMAALSVKCNLTGSSAVPTDCTSLPNPFSAGTSLYPISNGFYNDTNSTFLANTLAAKNSVTGVPAAISTCCTWLNTYLSGVDSLGVVTNYSIHPLGTGSLWTTVTAARSSDSSSGSPQNIIPFNCVEVHDNTTVAHLNWCGYDAAYITSTATPSRTLAREISVFNTGTASTAEDPFNFNPTVPSSENLRLDCSSGGGFGGNDCGAALAIIPNGAKHISAIIVANGALDTGTNANPDAISLPPAYSISWYNAAAAKTWQLYAGSGANGNLNLATGGNGALAVTALSEITGQGLTSYSPTLACNSGTLTTASATGEYRQLGKTVFVEMNISITTNGSCAGNITATLPFTVGSTAWILSGRGNVVSGKMLQGYAGVGATTVTVSNYDNSYPGSTGETLIVSGVFKRN